MSFFLGIDCGGTFIKATIFSQNGELIASLRESVEVISEKAGYAERDMDKLWAVCAKVIKNTIQKSGIEAQSIKAVGISAQGKGAFLLDKDKKPLGRAILSSDQRSLEIVKQWQKEEIPQKLYLKTRQTLWTGHPVSILRWLKENDSTRYNKIAYILMSHDYLRYCLTGELFCEETNISESNLYNMEKGNYDPELFKLLGIEEMQSALPMLVSSNKIAGFIKKPAADLTGLSEGTPVVGGLFDVVSTAFCAGLDDETKLNAVLGTWSVVSGISDYIDDSQKIAFVYGKYAQQGKYIIHEASPTSAGNLEWFVKNWNLSYTDINNAIANIPNKGQSSVLFLPFLYGSNAGLGMMSGFYGIQSHHNQAHLLEAIYEGCLFSLYYHLERMMLRFPNTKILRITGGPTKSAVWMQMLADLTNIKLEIPQIEETGSFGAALMAMEGVGNDITSLYQNSATKEIYPNSKNHPYYQEKYQKYQKLLEGLKIMI